ncbi:isoprenylcysteine carboxylmethyltransferase family protein [bacterium]|nr:isoprenylcysteine carboxylmethyltransferase family protein [bacterium]
MQILPPIWLLLSIVGMLLTHYFSPNIKLYTLNPFIFLTGLLLILFGFVLVIYCASLFRKHETPLRPFKESTALITSGPFKYSRNPIYLGMAIILIGIALLLGSLIPFLIVLGFFLIIHNQYVLREEIFMEKIFGEKFSLYKRSVRRWI